MDRKTPEAKGKPAREERLAAKLRENLHRRKAQARAQDSTALDPSIPDPGNAALPKSPPKS